MSYDNSGSFSPTGEEMGTSTAGATESFFTDNDDVETDSEQLYGDGTPIEDITDLSYTVVDYATGEFEVTNNTASNYTITIDYTFTFSPFGQFIEKTAAAPAAEGEAGSGGGNMAVWSTSRDNQVTTLVTGPDFDDSSAFGLPAAVFGVTFNQTLSEAEKLIDQPPGDSEKGASTNDEDMDIFTDDTIDRQTKLETLLVGRDFTSSQVGYTMPVGVYGIDFNQTAAEAEHDLALPPAGAEEGENVAASIRFYGVVEIAKELDDLPNTDTLEIGGTTITIEGADDFQEAVTTSATEGDYEVSLPKKAETDTYTITADNTYFGETTETITVDPNAVDHEYNVYYEVARFSGVPSRAAQFGSPVIG